MPVSQKETQEIAAAYTAAWNAGSAAAFYAPTGRIVISNGTPWENRDGVEQMAAGFFADVPDLSLTCDAVRSAGGHLVCMWTFTGHHSGSQNLLNIVGWQEWDMDENGLVAASRGWFDGADYARQVAGG
jgi:predicted ester cyclase